MRKKILVILAIGILLVLSNSIFAAAAVSTTSSSFTLRSSDDINATSYDNTPADGFYGNIGEYPAGPFTFYQEHFIEFDISGLGLSTATYLDFDLNNISTHGAYGDDHNISLAYYTGSNSATPDLNLYGTGAIITTELVPDLGINSFRIDVTSIYDSFAGNYLGFRFYDPVWTDAPTVGDQIQFNSATLTTTVVPEPISTTLFVVGGTLLAGRRFIKRKKAVL